MIFCIIMAIGSFGILLSLNQMVTQKFAIDGTKELARLLTHDALAIESLKAPYANLAREHIEKAKSYYLAALEALQSKQFDIALDNVKNGKLNSELAVCLLGKQATKDACSGDRVASSFWST
ncbi:MAG: hypothetical protein K2W95_05820 [Candidatus Obscuribacterales bacterium]|nr:hypothetical protein [Candidatus Obscuribacterales bacterium]